MKKALITGITGQDGSYLAELLIEKGYEVHGIRRRSSLFNTGRIEHLFSDSHLPGNKLFLHYGDMSDSSSIINILQKVKPDEIYNLAAMSHVHVSFQIPEYTADVDALGTLRILEAVRMLGLGNHTRIYQASTSELYGMVQAIPQSETTPFYPRSPYAVAKLYSFWITVNYREAYNMYACNGILFNHESPRRGETFVTRKITRAVVDIAYGKQKCLYLGNLDSQRDWGHAKDFVEGMFLMLQQNKPEDFVLATGVTTKIREFVKLCFLELGIFVEFEGVNDSEVGYVVDFNSEYNIQKGDIVVRVDPKYYRPTEVDLLIGDPKKAISQLGWQPKYDLKGLIKEMIEAEKNIVHSTKNNG